MQSTLLRGMREELSFNESITALNTLEAKLKTVKDKQIKRFEEMRLSRNNVWERAEKAYTQHFALSDKEEMRKIKDSLKRLSQIDGKRERVSTEREEISEIKRKELADLIESKRKKRSQLSAQRFQWSMTVLEKHRKQESQVKQQEENFSEILLAKKEYSTLRREDQALNLKEIVQAYREDLNRVKEKHYQLHC